MSEPTPEQVEALAASRWERERHHKPGGDRAWVAQNVTTCQVLPVPYEERRFPLADARTDLRAALAVAGAPDETDCCNRNDPSENHAPGCKGKARAAVAGAAERITHGRHCLCSACAAQDWAEPQLAPCGMHGPSCPPVYAPLGAAGDSVGAVAGAAPQTTRNVITQEDLEERERAGDRQMPGAWTFATPPPDDYEGRVVCFEVVRLGDHAHIGISTGRQHASGKASRPTFHRGTAGRIIVAWEDWLHWRAALDAGPEWMWVAEVENPTPAQLDRYTAGAAPADDCASCGGTGRVEGERTCRDHHGDARTRVPHTHASDVECKTCGGSGAAGSQDERLRRMEDALIFVADVNDGLLPRDAKQAAVRTMTLMRERACAALSSPVQPADDHEFKERLGRAVERNREALDLLAPNDVREG